MILKLTKNISGEVVLKLIDRLSAMGFGTVIEEVDGCSAIGIVSGIDSKTIMEDFIHLPYVESVVPFSQQFKLAGKDVRQNSLEIFCKNKHVCGNELCVMAGPCSIESEEQIYSIAKVVANAGGNILRGGAFKPRTSPYSFQGLGLEGIKFIRDAAKEYNLLTVSEVMDHMQLELAADKIDILQLGTRNMQNFSLLKELGKVKNPILLKRGFSATYKDLLMSAEYILNAGNPNVILCERGIRTFENYTRNTLDVCAAPVLHELSHLPVIIDPSHGTGIRKFVEPMCRAAIAAGADGVMVEIHYDPDKAFSDAQQTISTETFTKMMPSLFMIHDLVRRI